MSTAAVIAGLGIAAAGCGQGQNVAGPKATPTTVPAPPSPCAKLPNGVAQDGTNDEQGGSVPGIHPCDGPGN